jgi:hypothetical protein
VPLGAGASQPQDMPERCPIAPEGACRSAAPRAPVGTTTETSGLGVVTIVALGFE